MTLPHEKEKHLVALMARVVDMVARDAGFARTCLTCHHFNEATEICGKYNIRPPVRVLVNSCPEWEKEPF